MIYRRQHGAWKVEDAGVITSFNERYVFVHYDGWAEGGVATLRADLVWEGEKR